MRGSRTTYSFMRKHNIYAYTCLPPTLKLYIPRNSRHENSTTYYDFCLYIHTSVSIHTYVVPYIYNIFSTYTNNRTQSLQKLYTNNIYDTHIYFHVCRTAGGQQRSIVAIATSCTRSTYTDIFDREKMTHH